jgi:hypothetical protein
VSDSSGPPIAFGNTNTGRFIAVVVDVPNLNDPLIIRPITGTKASVEQEHIR